MNLGGTGVVSNFNFLRSAVVHIRAGGLLIYPTETAYALGCDATNPAAVRAIFRVKGRERGKPLPLIVASNAMAERYARFTPLARRLAKQYWPGPLTIVAASRLTPVISPHLSEGEREGVEVGSARFARRSSESEGGGWGQLAPGVVARDGTIAIRVSPHPIARALSRRLGRPIISTSANRSGQPPCYSVRSALRSLNLNFLPLPPGGGTRGGGLRTAALDIGPLPRRRPSTIVDARGDRLIIIRKGSIRV